MKELLGHRLSSTSSQEAKVEWGDIVEGEHRLWSHVSDPYKHTIRAFLVNFHTHVLLQSTESFSYRNGSIGRALVSSMAKHICCSEENAPSQH